MQKRRITILPSPSEITYGFCFLAFQVLFLGLAIMAVATLLRVPIGDLALNIIYFIISTAAVLLIFHRLHRENFAIFRANAKKIFKAVLIALPIYYVVSIAVNSTIEAAFPDFFNRNDTFLAEMMETNFGLVLLICVVFAPIVEETLYRGMLFASLTQVNRAVAYGVTILFFSMVHILGHLSTMNVTDVLLSAAQYMPATIVFCMLYERTNCLWAPMLLHAALNLLSCAVMRFIGG